MGVLLFDAGVKVAIGAEGEGQDLDDIAQLASLIAWAKPRLEAQLSRTP